MSNYNYSQGKGGHGDPKQLMVYFDKLGPKLRQVLNEAQIMWGPVNLYMEGIVRRGMSDEALAAMVAKNDATMVAKMEAERQSSHGVWSCQGFTLKTSKVRQERNERAVIQRRTGRSHRPNRAWVAAAAKAAVKASRHIPRSPVVKPADTT